MDDVADVELVHGAIGLLDDEPAGRVDVDRRARASDSIAAGNSTLISRPIVSRSARYRSAQSAGSASKAARMAPSTWLTVTCGAIVPSSLAAPSGAQPTFSPTPTTTAPDFAERWARIPANFWPSSSTSFGHLSARWLRAR